MGGDRRWLYLVTAILAVVVLVMNIPFIQEDLLHAETFSTFVTTVVGVLALLVAGVAGAAIFARRALEAARPVALVAIALAVVGSVAATATAGDDGKAAGDIELVAEQFDYPEQLAAKPCKVAFFIENRDHVRHTSVIAAMT